MTDLEVAARIIIGSAKIKQTYENDLMPEIFNVLHEAGYDSVEVSDGYEQRIKTAILMILWDVQHTYFEQYRVGEGE